MFYSVLIFLTTLLKLQESRRWRRIYRRKINPLSKISWIVCLLSDSNLAQCSNHSTARCSVQNAIRLHAPLACEWISSQATSTFPVNLDFGCKHFLPHTLWIDTSTRYTFLTNQNKRYNNDRHKSQVLCYMAKHKMQCKFGAGCWCYIHKWFRYQVDVPCVGSVSTTILTINVI